MYIKDILQKTMYQTKHANNDQLLSGQYQDRT